MVSRKVGEILDERIGGREIFLGVAPEERLALVAQQGIPIPAQVTLEVIVSSVDLVDGDELSVARKCQKECTGTASPLDDEIITSCFLQKVSYLQPCWPRAQHKVL